MARRPRLAAQAAAASMRTPIPQLPETSDDEMADAPPSDAATPKEDEEDQNEDDEDEDDDGEPEEADGAENAPGSEAPSRSATPRRSGRSTSILPRKRRLGRPPKSRPAGSDDDRADHASDVGTPKKRGGFRGKGGGGGASGGGGGGSAGAGSGSGRWGKPRGGPSHVTQVPIDKEGNMMDVINDEVDLPEDPEGETKVDKLGNLQDGREFRVRIFTILGRGKRQYMLSTEPARCIGFRDSYLFFQKHKLLYKIIIDDDEKRDLIDRDLIPHSYKGRAIGVVTARSVFREFGAKIIIGGKKVIDDYGVRAARARGDMEGEIAVPEDRLPLPGEPYNRNQYVAWHGASSVYHSGAPSVPMPNGKMVEGKKRKIAVTSDNWMLEHAREASRFNSLLAIDRKDSQTLGFYDIHTNVIQWPKSVQPGHARWEAVEPEPDRTADGAVVPIMTNGNTTTVPDDSDAIKPEVDNAPETIFPKLDPVYTRNFMIHDICFESATSSNLAEPGPGLEDCGDGPQDFSAPSGLHGISQAIVDELPPECRQAFVEARDKDVEWRNKWQTEANDGHRAQFLSTTAWFF